MNIVLLGAPGSGKGTQSKQLCKRFDLQHIATGDLFRENINNNTELGKLAKALMNRGELVPDDVTVGMLQARLSQPDIQNGFILDGFPRTLPQVEALTNILATMNMQMVAVLYFKVDDEELIIRLSGRRICRECQLSFHIKYNPFETCPYQKCEGEYLYQRDDDTVDVVRARIQTFKNETKPLIDYYAAKDLLVELDGMQNIETVTAQAIAAIAPRLEQMKLEGY